MGLKIKIKRIEKGYKQKDFADYIGISRHYLTAIENDIAKNPSKKIMIKIAKALDSSVEELFFSEL